MKISNLPLPGLLLIEPTVYRDERGFFMERYHRVKLKENGLPFDFIQDNHSRSLPGVLRGLHFQSDPPQGKLLGVVSGRIWDAVVDIRPGSPTYKQTFALELNDENKYLFWVPPGFAHGFCVLGDQAADVFYKMDAYHNPAGENGIFWKDSDLAIPWPITNPIVSARDQKLQSFAEYHSHPIPWMV